jgi:hypothetical protein
MHRSFICLVFVTALTLSILGWAKQAQAQAGSLSCYGVLDLAPMAIGLAGACSYGNPRASWGVFAGMYHPRSIEAFRPNIEAYSFVDVGLWGTWHSSLHLGMGWTEATGMTVRSFLVITNPGWTVAPWVNLYSHTNFDTTPYAQVRAGVRIKAGAHAALVFYGEAPFATPISAVPLGVFVAFY